MTFYTAKYKNQTSMEFDVEVVTPMFLGGADNLDAELRVPSIKGMLRFWWRATCGIESLEKLRGKEANLFGSTEKKSSFSLYISGSENVNTQLNLKERGRTFQVHGHNISILDYLSYGTHKRGKGENVYTKKHITPGSSFSLNLVFRNGSNRESILKAFSYLFTYGGLGSRNRNGFGAMAAKNQTVSLDSSGDLSLFSAVSARSKLFVFSQTNTWVDALSDIGLAYRDAKTSVEPHYAYDKRKLVVAPITVKKRNMADLDRHAKPYFLHVNKLDDGKYQGQILFMPYKYYQPEKHDEYMATCNKMNETIAKIAKG